MSSLDKPLETEDGDVNLADMIQDKIPVKYEAMAFKNYYKFKYKKSVRIIAEEHGMDEGKLNRVINKGIGTIKLRYQDELIEKYADGISSYIRKEREEDLLAMGTQT